MGLEWSEFAQRFARELAALPRDTILIVRERDEIRHYVQAMWEPDRLYAEAVSNNFLEGPLLLKPADEEVLGEAGWRPPAQQVSANWWTELADGLGAGDFDQLADMMVTALRDVQGVRRPSDLVYESFRRLGTGLIDLVDFGIEVADPHRVTERLSSVSSLTDQAPPVIAAPVSEQPAGPTLEERLAQARQAGDHVTYFELLMHAELVLPATGQAVEDPGLTEFATTTMDGVTLVVVFTSPGAMFEAYGSDAGLYRRSSFREIANAWPDPAWSMTVNPGLPSCSILDSATVARLEVMRRTAEQAATVDAVVAPQPPGTAVRLPHGTRLWRLPEGPGAAEPVAVYDGMNARWTAALASATQPPDPGASPPAGESHG
jgi:hypothetical protein